MEINNTQRIMCEIIDIFEKYDVSTELAYSILIRTVKIIKLVEEGEDLCKK